MNNALHPMNWVELKA
ncbi:unnamed protein product, partial [Rotaria sp. Silwood2]